MRTKSRDLNFKFRLVAALIGGASVIAIPLAVDAGPAGAAVSPVGTYTNHYNNGTSATMVIASNDTLTITFSFGTDSGSWVAQGKTIALAITSATGDSIDAGCVYVGKILHSGINSSRKPGDENCPQVPASFTWYAVKS